MLNIIKSIKGKLVFSNTVLLILVLIMLAISMWIANTLNMITTFQRWERVHTVSLNKAIAYYYKYRENPKTEYLEKYQENITTPLNYSTTFSTMLTDIEQDGFDKTSKKLSQVFAKQTTTSMNQIILQRVYLLQWHPLVKRLIKIAFDEAQATRKFKEQIKELLTEDDAEKKSRLESDFKKNEVFLLSNAENFGKTLAELSEFAIKLVQAAMIILTILIVLFVILLTQIIRKSIEKQIDIYSNKFEDLATKGGDLTSTLDTSRKDEMQILAISMNTFLAKLKEIISRIKESSIKMYATSESFRESSRAVQSSSQKEAAAVQNISASVEQLNQSIDKVSLDSEEQDKEMQSILQKIKTLINSFADMKEKIDISLRKGSEISRNAEQGEQALVMMEKSMGSIAESSKKINNIIKIINSISNKINLLSLNAAIEAERAGESGSGFAVVADEISKLADQTSGSIKQVANLVTENNEEIEAGISKVGSVSVAIEKIIKDVYSMQKSLNDISQAANQQGINIEEVGGKVKILKQKAESIKTLIVEDRKGMEDISKSMAELNLNSQANATESDRLRDKSLELTAIIKQINHNIKEFKTESQN